ncbi:peptidoglycan D,D-transpeptidase FtsI family protein [Rhodosalinus sp.]|uniref:peptidoglycan D,D-transpeptidase FtsI family protein n=1 Tax=Rhodosalinus sp. TaxID=2047741 RepID=UPI00397B9314
MIRRPLRPLARILEARARGESPDAIERENIRLRHEAMRDTLRQRAEIRLTVLGVGFICAFAVIGARMADLAASDPEEPRVHASAASIIAQRADITDRHGHVLATNMETHSLYAHPQDMIEPERAARELAALFPELDEERLLKDFTGDRKFLWIRRQLSPEQKQAVHDIGEPGLLFGPREMRLYPNGAIAAHVLGSAGFGREGVHAAEVVGRAGVEKTFDALLRDPARGGAPLALSLDLTVQAAAERVLEGAMRIFNARGAAAVLMDVHSGEVLSLVSLPDFDPNDRPPPSTEGNAGDSPTFNRAVQGVYELGSTFKIFTVAQALELGLVDPDTVIDTAGPMRIGGFTIREFRNRNYGELSVAEIIVESSNRGTARLAMQIGGERQREFLDRLGLLDPVPLEMPEARGGAPLVPKRWGELSTVTVSYGHGISVTPLHLATAYATLANGGHRVTPTLLRQEAPETGPRVLSPDVAAASMDMLRRVVTEGTASMAEVRGYRVAGKTGTADKPRPTGGYFEDRVIASFASVFPADDPQYALVVALDEPVETSGSEPRRSAGWTAVPVAAELTRRVAPLLGLRPEIEPAPLEGVTLTAN